MSKHFMKYWLYETVEFESQSEDPMLDHSASDQYRRANANDHIWVVTIPPQTQTLLLFGHMKIGSIVNQIEAARLLRRDPDEIWEANFHAISVPYDPEPYEIIDITSIARDLRFVSPSGKDRLLVDNWGQALQTMRELTPETVSLLRDIWYGECDVSSEPEKDEFSQDLFREGKLRLQAHYRRERSTKLVSLAKQQFKTKHGRLFCEVCRFDFSLFYGDIGADFIEAHHREPLSELDIHDTRETTIADLAMVCANCHRMLHRRKPWLSIEELKTILKSD